MDTLIAGLKDAVEEAKPVTMIALYGLGQSSAVRPNLAGELTATFVDVLYDAGFDAVVCKPCRPQRYCCAVMGYSML